MHPPFGLLAVQIGKFNGFILILKDCFGDYASPNAGLAARLPANCAGKTVNAYVIP